MRSDFFPQGLALNENFCNRLIEQKRLETDIQLAKPVLIISPRRYGKTSLALNVLHRLKMPFSHIDLYAHLNEIEVQDTILSTVGNLLYTIESDPKKALQWVTDFFADMNVSFKWTDTRVQVDFSRSRKSPAKTVLDTLQKFDGVLEKKNKKVVLFFDEFQRLSQITDNATLEGAIRHIAQKSKQISFVFSGSNRHLLSRMFDDRTKPFYKLCDRLTLDRISSADYLPFIQKKSLACWKEHLDDSVINAILAITQRHPYYVNLLCYRLWRMKEPPTEEKIPMTWHQYALEEKSNVMNEMELLSRNQAKMLMAIAKYGCDISPTSAEFIALTKFSLSSASQTIQVLQQKDYIFMDQDHRYGIVDPLIQYLFAN